MASIYDRLKNSKRRNGKILAIVMGLSSPLWFTSCFGFVGNSSSDKIVHTTSSEKIASKADKEARKLAEERAVKELKNKDKSFQKIAKEDSKQIAQLASEKLSLRDFLYQLSEPKYFVIAPMTYSTEKFVNNNSRDKGMFGSKKDKSVMRLALLEDAILKFENYIDDMIGVSFLDRSKIAQIEKEHKFQLSDWSNDKKTAEVGRALNANVLLFLDKFNFLDQNGGEYRFEAKFVDINTMQTSSFMLVYRGKNLKEPVETLRRINFRSFTSLSSKKNPFEDEISLSTVKKIRIAQTPKIRFGNNLNACPFGYAKKIDFSEYDINTPNSQLREVSSVKADGFNAVELTANGEIYSGTYTFEPCDLYIERIGNDFYTDGKIGTLTIKTDSSYEKLDVFTVNGREYFLKLGTVELPKVTVNYYLQMVKN